MKAHPCLTDHCAIAISKCRTYSGFRRLLARVLRRLLPMQHEQLSTSINAAVRILRNTGYEAGPFLEDIFNAYCSYEYAAQDGLSPSECLVAAWSHVHDAIVSLRSSRTVCIAAFDTLNDSSDYFVDA